MRLWKKRIGSPLGTKQRNLLGKKTFSQLEGNQAGKDPRVEGGKFCDSVFHSSWGETKWKDNHPPQSHHGEGRVNVVNQGIPGEREVAAGGSRRKKNKGGGEEIKIVKEKGRVKSSRQRGNRTGPGLHIAILLPNVSHPKTKTGKGGRRMKVQQRIEGRWGGPKDSS